MAIKIGKKTYRNLPEQVEENKNVVNSFETRVETLETSVPSLVKESVDKYVTDAKASAESASKSALNATTAMNNAKSYANKAEESAKKASESASNCASIKNETATFASNAKASADACAESEKNAKASEENSKTIESNVDSMVTNALISGKTADLGATNVSSITINKQNIIDYIFEPKNFTWKQIQKFTRMGIISSFFDVGDQLIVKKNNREIVFDILGFDQETPVDTDHTHSLTLGMHYCYAGMAFDAGEALIYCVTGLPAGDYKFTYKTNTYYFNMPSVAKAGSQLKTPDQQESPSTIYVYDSATSTTASQTIKLSTTEISGAYDLGTFKGNDSSLVEETTVNGATIKRNDLYRVAWGSNNWANSNIRQWLNSDKTKGNYYEPKTVFDRPSSYMSSTDGFLYGLDPELVSVLGKVKKTTQLNNIDDGSGTETTEELAFLLSMGEIGMSGYSSQGNQYEYFKRRCGENMKDDWSTAYSGLKKTYSSGSSMWWWLRSPTPWRTTSPRSVHDSGVVRNGNAISGGGVVVALSIV